MDINQVAELSNENIQRMLVDSNKLPLLEEVINDEYKELNILMNLEEKGKLDFGHIPSKEELSEIIQQTRKEVDSFLNTQNIKDFDFGYKGVLNKYTAHSLKEAAKEGWAISFGVALFGGGGISTYIVHESMGLSLETTPYVLAGTGIFMSLATLAALVHSSVIIAKRLNKRNSEYIEDIGFLDLRKIERTKLIPSGAHEIGHHILAEKLKNIFGDEIPYPDITSFKEGFCRGIERHISKLYAEKENNGSYMYNICARSYRELSIAYKWVCKKLNKKPNEKLLNFTDKSKKFIEKAIRKGKHPNKYDLGNTFFYLQETLQPNRNIYLNVLNGNFQPA